MFTDSDCLPATGLDSGWIAVAVLVAVAIVALGVVALRRSRAGVALLLVPLALLSVVLGSSPSAQAATSAACARVTVFPAGAQVDYQLGGAYPPPAGVTVVARDSTEDPAPGIYSICYINGFQTQPGEAWPDELLLRDEFGEPVVDPNWPDEYLLDISTPEAREANAARRIATILACAANCFDAVEFDNLDSYTRSEGAFDIDDAIAYATLLTNAAHEHGLAVGQKNTPQLGTLGRDVIGFDFAVAEGCARYDECAAYTDVYGAAVIDIEYSDDLPVPFADVCADAATPASTILRDRGLSTPGSPDYVYEAC